MAPKINKLAPIQIVAPKINKMAPKINKMAPIQTWHQKLIKWHQFRTWPFFLTTHMLKLVFIVVMCVRHCCKQIALIVSSLFCNFNTKILDESFANCSGKWSRKKAAVLLDFVNHGQKYFVGDITF